MLLLFLGLVFIVFILVVALNPNFWQGYRNSKFIDEYLNEQLKSDKDAEIKDIIK